MKQNVCDFCGNDYGKTMKDLDDFKIARQGHYSGDELFRVLPMMVFGKKRNLCRSCRSTVELISHMTFQLPDKYNKYALSEVQKSLDTVARRSCWINGIINSAFTRFMSIISDIVKTSEPEEYKNLFQKAINQLIRAELKQNNSKFNKGHFMFTVTVHVEHIKEIEELVKKIEQEYNAELLNKGRHTYICTILEDRLVHPCTLRFAVDHNTKEVIL